MRQTSCGWMVASASAVFGLVACIEGESPIVGTQEETGGTGGTGVGGTTGGGTMGGTPVESSNYFLARLQTGSALEACMPRRLGVDAAGRATCTISSASASEDGAECDCGAVGREEIDAERRAAVLEHLYQTGYCDGDGEQGAPSCDDLCTCDVAQAAGSDWSECEQNPSPEGGARGWCYVAPDQGVGVPALVASCEREPKARIRFLDGTLLPTDTALVLGCHGETPLPTQGDSESAALGEPCLPDDEYQHAFSSFYVNEVTVVTGSRACASNLCLVNHFQGRVNCPYGQTAEQAANDPQCFLPGTNVAVTVPVEPQLQERRAESAAICSCRCDGPGDGPFCACGEGMQCVPLLEQLGLPGDEQLAGSYCIPTGTAYDATRPPVPSLICDRDSMNCGEPHPY